MMRNGIFILASLLLACLPVRADVGYSAGIAQADELIEQGKFKAADTLLRNTFADKSLSAESRRKVEFQIDWIERIRQDYPFTREALFQKLSNSVHDLTRAEFDRWVVTGWFDERMIDGVEKFVGTSVSNLYFRHPSLVVRRMDGKDHTVEEHGRLDNARAIVAATWEEHTPYVLPYHLKNSLVVKLDKTAAPAGQTIRGWLPFPLVNGHQRDVKILASLPQKTLIAPASSPIRSVYMEEEADGKKSPEFIVQFSYTSYGVHFELNPADIQPPDLTNPELKKFTSESPHVIFNDKIKELAQKIAGHETNPMLKAKAFFDWISGNIRYSYAREYSTLTNLSEYTVCNGYGDCGQEAMLFITLCRSVGIPARWETGWDLWPDDHDIHDWSEIYLAPYGWVPCDPWAAIFAKQYCTALTPPERLELRDFYFGGLDQWRMIANSDHSQPLMPAKNSFRSDDIDFQRGEFEWGNHNIYFNKYDSYKMNVEKLDIP